MNERARGVVLYFLAAVLLLAGVLWWWRAAPRELVDPQMVALRLTAERLLPDTGEYERAESVGLPAGGAREVVAPVGGGGDFRVSVVCAGGDGTRVRFAFSATDGDSGLGLRCSGDRTPLVLQVALADRLYVRISVDEAGPIVFRYAVERALG